MKIHPMHLKNTNIRIPRNALIALLLFAHVIKAVNAADALASDRAKNMVLLNDDAVRNLRLETEVVLERNFETTVFAIGRIEDIPSRLYSLSSRISGVAVEINAFVGDKVKKGQLLVKVESRQPGNPPPTISLEALRDGLVIESHVLTGQPVEPDTDLLDIADRSEMWAIAKIPEQEAANIRPGTQARIFLPALGGEPVFATLIRYGVSADRESGTVSGVFQIPNMDGRMQPGMRAEFSIITSNREGVLAAPRTAVQGDPANRVVYAKDFDIPNAFVRSPVVLGEENDAYIEIISGLFPGDDVVTRGSYLLGFVGGGSGPSLKDALDAAHGHEHNEDGSELGPESKKNDVASDAHDHGTYTDDGPHGQTLRYYAIAMTLLALVLAGKLLRSHKSKPSA
ncbi:MAG: efflux RND transporter periplasmic adaptor subunit [Verrucomicrobia bacterium]|nr:efflux RND transporter periplasmic adaptor subunit [Verrucomicrobiota bacterium]